MVRVYSDSIIKGFGPTVIYIYILAENPPYGRAFQLAPAEGINGAFGPKTYSYFSLAKEESWKNSAFIKNLILKN